MFRAWAVLSHARESISSLSRASGQCTLWHGRGGGVPQYHSRSQNPRDINDVVALLFCHGGPHDVLVREGSVGVGPPVVSLKRTHLLDEHLLVCCEVLTVAKCSAMRSAHCQAGPRRPADGGLAAQWLAEYGPTEGTELCLAVLCVCVVGPGVRLWA